MQRNTFLFFSRITSHLASQTEPPFVRQIEPPLFPLDLDLALGRPISPDCIFHLGIADSRGLSV
jgi:hypothetical protein